MHAHSRLLFDLPPNNPMPSRSLTIQPFISPSGEGIDVDITIDLVDQYNRRVTGLTDPDGDPIMDRVQVSMSDESQIISIWPNEEIEGIAPAGSAASADTYYLVTILHRSTRFREKLRTNVGSGGSIDWATFLAGGTITPGSSTAGAIRDDVLAALGTIVSAPPSDGSYYAYKDGAWVDITYKIINP